jgi:hypothetical protein
MRDACVVSRTVTSRDPDPATGRPAETTTPIYSGRCELVAGDTEARDIDSGSRDLTQQRSVLKIPVDDVGSASVAAGDTVVITLFHNGEEPVVVRARVKAGHHQTSAVSRRIAVEVTSNG